MISKTFVKKTKRQAQFLLDDKDALLISGKSCYLSSSGYIVVYSGVNEGKPTLTPLHRLVLGAKKGQLVDHIDGNRLDNRSANLRFVTTAQNMMNSRPIFKKSSPFKGVYKTKHNRWRTQIKKDGISKYIGTFITERDAAKAYNEYAVDYFGEFARLNVV